jgi:NitT/TauT family transport system ATP-binding protein
MPTVALPAAPAALAFEGAAKTWPNGTVALAPTDLAVAPGEFVALLGPSGCGKSTLLRLAAGLVVPSAGDVRTTTTQPGFVFQEPTLMPWTRVLENVRLPLELNGTPRPAADARARAALERVGLAGSERLRPRELSGGMKMRVSIARCLVTEPTLLLLDEPFAALDEITRWRLDDELLALWREQGLTVLFVTHSIHEAAYLAQRVLVMAARPGRIVQEVAIAAPPRRDADFRVSTAFAQAAARLQAALQAAS